jgi:hypothetical protein
MSDVSSSGRDTQRGKNLVAIFFIACATIVCLASIAASTIVLLGLIRVSP